MTEDYLPDGTEVEWVTHATPLGESERGTVIAHFSDRDKNVFAVIETVKGKKYVACRYLKRV